MLINFGGHTTDVGIVFGGELINTSSIRIGTESLVSYIAVKTEKDRDRVVESLLAEKLDRSEEKELQKTFENFWLESLLKSLDSIDGIKIYPNLIMIYGDEQLSIDKNRILAQLEKLKFKDTPEIHRLTEKIISEIEYPIILQSLGNFIQNLK